MPYAYDFLAKKVWQYSHTKKVNQLQGHVNLLQVLADMAKHNNPKPVDNNPLDAFKTAGNSAAEVASAFSIVFTNNIPQQNYFSQYTEHLYLVFHRHDTPPPRVA